MGAAASMYKTILVPTVGLGDGGEESVDGV